MKTRFFSILITCFIISSVFSQTNLNQYKYVIVSKKYDFLKEADQYQLNSLSKFLFNKYGFEALMEGEDYPEDLIKNRCLGLKSDVIKDSGMFKTKLTVELVDCNDKVVYTSEMGESREKEYAKAYNEAIRNAFNSLATLNYKYEPVKSNDVASENLVTVKTKTETTHEIQKLKEEIQTLKKEKEVEVTEKKDPTTEPVKNAYVIELKTETVNPADKSQLFLYAQAIKNGFQLVDSTPKVVYKIKQTGLSNVFLVDDKNAILYKKGEIYILEYYTNNVLIQEVLNIKF